MTNWRHGAAPAMPSEGSRLHGFTVVSRTLRLGRQLVIPAVLGGASIGSGLGAVVQWTLVILALPSLAIAVAQWLAFRYRLDDDELIIDSGVLSRRRRVIPVARLQNVDLQQSPLERMAGVAELRLETASGGAETEARLAVLAVEEARALQAELLGRRASTGDARRPTGPATAEAAPAPRVQDHDTDAHAPSVAADRQEPETLLQLSVADLAIAGATANEAGLIAAGLATGLELLGDLGAMDRVDAWLEGVFEQSAGLGVTGALMAGAVLVIGFIVLGWLVSIVATVTRFYGFTLTLDGEDLRREYGLVSRHQTTVPLKRIQSVRIEETLLRRPLGLAALKIETAGAGPQQRQNTPGGGAEAYVPLARRRDVPRLIRTVFPDARFHDVELNPVARVSQRRSFVRLAVPIAVAAAVGAWLDPRGLALAGLLVPAWFVARAQYRARAWARADGYTIVRSGVLTRTNALVPEARIQTLHVTETPFQRRWDIGDLVVDTAGSGRVARAVDLPRTTAQKLLLALATDITRR